MTRIGVVGAGRVGAVLAAALRQAGHEIVAVSGESGASRARIEALLPGVPVDKPSAVARAAEILWLTVPDDSLPDVTAMLSASDAIHEGQYVVHASGRHGTDVLRPAAERGAHVAAVHPAMTFTGTDLDLPRLSGTVFGCTADPGARATVETLVHDVSGRAVWLAPEQRVLYHAALVHGANHLVTLINQSTELLRGLGVDDPAAVLGPVTRAALDNTLAYGHAALTGPIVRGDVQTVRDHLSALAGTSLETLESYVTMGRATANHAVLDGRLRPADAAAVVEALDDAWERAAR